MVQFTISLAGVPIGVKALYESTQRFCADYLTGDAPCLEISIGQSEIDAERVHAAEEHAREGLPEGNYSDAYLETLALYRKIAAALVDRDVLLFHGSVIAHAGEAYVFTAPSGTGKTTHTRLWLKNIPDCHVLNGDKPLLLFKDDAVYACGTPWQGKENYGTNEILPVRAVIILGRGSRNLIERIPFSKAVSVLTTQSHHPAGNAGLLKSMQLVQKLAGTEMYFLRCNMEDDAAWTAYEGISGTQNRPLSHRRADDI